MGIWERGVPGGSEVGWAYNKGWSESSQVSGGASGGGAGRSLALVRSVGVILSTRGVVLEASGAVTVEAIERGDPRATSGKRPPPPPPPALMTAGKILR